jgi:CDP-glucose 4,6-dehydratase
MHYLVTGHTGFKGAWLVQMLHAQGHQVSGLALEPVENALFTRAGVASLLVHDLRVDVRDGSATADAVRRIQPDVVIHLAAQALVREAYRDPRTTWETNVLGTYNVLDAVAGVDTVKAQLVITTDKVYRNPSRAGGHREDDPLGGSDPYSASKAAADILTQSWIGIGCNIPTAIARAGNVVGGGDVCTDRLLVDLVAAFSGGRDARLRNPGAVRPWQHVLDCLAGYLALVDALLAGEQAGEAFNFGPDPADFVDVDTVARTVADLWGTRSHIVLDTAGGPKETDVLTLDAAKARRELGWDGRLGWTEALAWTVEWTKRVLDGEPARSVCADQLEAFAALTPAQGLPAAAMGR